MLKTQKTAGPPCSYRECGPSASSVTWATARKSGWQMSPWRRHIFWFSNWNNNHHLSVPCKNSASLNVTCSQSTIRLKFRFWFCMSEVELSIVYFSQGAGPYYWLLEMELLQEVLITISNFFNVQKSLHKFGWQIHT